MNGTARVLVFLLLFASVPEPKPKTKASTPTQSLGALARKWRAERQAQGTRQVKVFTNDNVPHYGGISVIGNPHSLIEPALKRPHRAARSRRQREKRTTAAKDAFKREHPCPSTGEPSGPCPGYVIDHVKPLACGGPDDPSNMQWQTVAEGKAKDRWEREGCYR